MNGKIILKRAMLVLVVRRCEWEAPLHNGWLSEGRSGAEGKIR